MASNKTLNAKNLEALGAAHLAQLLMELSSGDAAAKRRLRLELAGARSPREAAKEVRKRLTTIGRSRSFIDWQKRKALISDLETQRQAIVDIVAKSDPDEALDLLWRFLDLADAVFERCDDSTGTVIGVFHAACSELGEIAEANGANQQALADRAFSALTQNDYGQFDTLIEDLAPALGNVGLDHLKSRFIELSDAPLSKPRDDEREVIGWSSQGPIYADDYAERQRDSAVRMALNRLPICKATLMVLSPRTASMRGPSQWWPLRSRGAFLQRAAQMKPGRLSPLLQKIGLAGFHLNGSRCASMYLMRWAGTRRPKPFAGPA